MWSTIQFTWSVFSTYVEVIPIFPKNTMINTSILHVCGGDPMTGIITVNIPEYSPRMWR